MSTCCRNSNIWKNKQVIFKNCALSSDYISENSNTLVDNARNLDVVMSRYNLIEHSINRKKTSRKATTVKMVTYIDYDVEPNEKYLKFTGF